MSNSKMEICLFWLLVAILVLNAVNVAWNWSLYPRVGRLESAIAQKATEQEQPEPAQQPLRKD
jgi:uncharacterized protein YhdP